MEKDKRAFGEEVKKNRLKRMLSQRELAEMVDVEYHTIMRIEKGYQYPQFRTLRKLHELGIIGGKND